MDLTLKRLLIVGDELAFMDRPSVTFKQWGTVGRNSPMRRLPFETAPVQVRVFEPPSGPAENFFLSYIEADLTSPDFRRIEADTAGVMYGECADDWNWPFVNGPRNNILRGILKAALNPQEGDGQIKHLRLANEYGMHARPAATLSRLSICGKRS
jgi:hypothetical protein